MIDARLDEIAALATPLAERLTGRYVAPSDDSGGSEAVETALARWRAVVADGRQDLFLRRLDWDGWPLDAVRRCLAPGRIKRPRATAWLTTLRAIGDAAGHRAANAARESWQDPDSPIAFEDVFAPHVAIASRTLQRQCAAVAVDLDELTPSAWRDLRRGLVERLSGLLGAALIDAFQRHRGFQASPVSLLMSAASEVNDTTLYASFVQALHRDRLMQWHREYPVAARLAATAVDAWVRTTFELLSRVAKDARLLHSALGLPLPLRLDHVRVGMSDPHSGGRSVHMLTFANGHKLLYKPRALGIDAAFMRFLDWCNERGAPLPLETHRIVDRGEYGFAQFVERAPCADAGAAERFHRRAGMLLAVFYAFGSSDCHFENFVARGEHLHLIDAEAVLPLALHRWGVKEDHGEGWYEANARLGRSVLSSGMLPQWQPSAQPGGRFNIGGLGGGLARGDRHDTWFNINTDQMGRVAWDRELPAHPNVPVLNGEPLNPAEYTTAILDGFHQMYDFLLRHRAELLSASGPLRAFAAQRTRLIFRPTRAYALLQHRTLEADCLQDSGLRSIELDRLSRAYLDVETPPALWAIVAHERRALERGDIPAFFADTDAVDLTLDGGDSVAGVFSASSIQTLHARVEALSDADRQYQSSLIRAALRPLATDRAHVVVAPAADTVKRYGRDELIAIAVRIAAEIAAQAIRGSDGSVSWLGREYSPDAEQFQLTPLGGDLFGGAAGIALFLAALDHVAGGDRHRELCLETIGPLRRRLSHLKGDPRAADRLKLGTGGMTGLGGVIYAFAKIGTFLPDKTLVNEAHDLTRLLTPELIARDVDFDVVAGSAGAILALLALDGDAPLDRASACARHLMASRTSFQQRPRAWASHGRPPLTGFSHGAAGISYALLRLYERTRDRELWETAQEGLAYERSVYSAPQKNWPDYRWPQHRFAMAWCHGAPGIGLARLAGLRISDDVQTREEIAVALEHTCREGLVPVDHLCCGNAGLLDILLCAARSLGEPKLLDHAEDLAARFVTRAAASGQFRLLSGGDDFLVPSLFQGAAGVGFALLRLAAPDRLPSVLLLE